MLIFLIVLCAFIFDGSNADSDFQKSEIKKCLCDGDTIPVNNTCVAHDQTFIHVWFSTENVGKDIHISEFGKITVEPLVCPQDYHAHKVDGLAVMSPYGSLLSREPETKLYCLEYYMNSHGMLRQRFEYCVYVEPIKLCCSNNQIIDNGDQCIDEETTPAWPSKFEYITEDITCQNAPLKELIIMSDDPESTNLIYDDHDVFYNETCLVAQEFNGNLSYYRKTCICDRQICIPFCCPPSMAFESETSSCVPNNFTKEMNIELPMRKRKRISIEMECTEIIPIDLEQNKRHQIFLDGSFQTDEGKLIPRNRYCLGVVLRNGFPTSSGLACPLEVPQSNCEWRFILIRVFLVVSCFFIILTLIVYLGVKSLRNRIGGACLISELIALLISQVVLVIIQTSQHQFSASGCLVMGVIELVFILASFLWLNVMCFDVWTTFRVLRPFNEKLLSPKLFIKYSLYAWGIPIVIGSIVLVAEIKELEPRPTFIVTEGCFFVPSSSDLVAHWVYLYGIILLLLCVNCAFFVHVGIKLRQVNKDQKKMFARGNSGSDSKANIENLKLHSKLFVIMGLPWLLEIFTSFATNEHECYIWLLDIFNLLRGVLIFIIFVCKDTTREKIGASWFPQKPAPNASLGSERSRKTSVMSLSTWLPSRKISSHKMDAIIQEENCANP